jgi:hypothetical protein
MPVVYAHSKRSAAQLLQGKKLSSMPLHLTNLASVMPVNYRWHLFAVVVVDDRLPRNLEGLLRSRWDLTKKFGLPP